VFGLVRDGHATVYREWAPAAKAVHLIGVRRSCAVPTACCLQGDPQEVSHMLPGTLPVCNTPQPASCWLGGLRDSAITSKSGAEFQQVTLSSLFGKPVIAMMHAGDFNNWGWDTPLERGEIGVWSVRLPDGAHLPYPQVHCTEPHHTAFHRTVLHCQHNIFTLL